MRSNDWSSADAARARAGRGPPETTLLGRRLGCQVHIFVESRQSAAGRLELRTSHPPRRPAALSHGSSLHGIIECMNLAPFQRPGQGSLCRHHRGKRNQITSVVDRRADGVGRGFTSFLLFPDDCCRATLKGTRRPPTALKTGARQMAVVARFSSVLKG